MTMSDSSIVGRAQSGRDIDSYRYLAPELQQPEDNGTDEILITKESDVYGMAMVVFEAGFHHPVPSSVRANSHVDLLGLDRGSAVLLVQRYRYTVKGTGHGIPPTVLRQDSWSDPGAP